MNRQDCWQNVGVVCAFACIPDFQSAEYGSPYPHWECDVHWVIHRPERGKVAMLSIAGWLKATVAPREANRNADFKQGFLHAVACIENQARLGEDK